MNAVSMETSSIGSLPAGGVTGSCKPSNMSTGNQTRVLWKIPVPALNHSPSLQPQQNLLKGDWVGVLEWSSLV